MKTRWPREYPCGHVECPIAPPRPVVVTDESKLVMLGTMAAPKRKKPTLASCHGNRNPSDPDSNGVWANIVDAYESEG